MTDRYDGQKDGVKRECNRVLWQHAVPNCSCIVALLSGSGNVACGVGAYYTAPYNPDPDAHHFTRVDHCLSEMTSLFFVWSSPVVRCNVRAT